MPKDHKRGGTKKEWTRIGNAWKRRTKMEHQLDDRTMSLQLGGGGKPKSRREHKPKKNKKIRSPQRSRGGKAKHIAEHSQMKSEVKTEKAGKIKSVRSAHKPEVYSKRKGETKWHSEHKALGLAKKKIKFWIMGEGRISKTHHYPPSIEKEKKALVDKDESKMLKIKKTPTMTTTTELPRQTFTKKKHKKGWKHLRLKFSDLKPWTEKDKKQGEN